MKRLLGLLISGALIAGSGAAFAQVKDSAKTVAKDTKKTVKATGHTVKKTTKKTVNKTATVTKKGASKVENKTK
jgi:hypothetical protein